MSTEAKPGDVANIAKQLPDAQKTAKDSFDVKTSEGYSEQVVDAIEMIGEETAAGLPPARDDGVTPGMRYLHCSRTIHQLVTDRNRAVGLFLGVASLLVTASSALINASPRENMIVPLAEIQRWSFPITFGVLTVMAVLTAFLLIRTRVGLIYEVAKMNALLGLPVGRVKRIAPLSIFFIMQLIVSLAGGACGGLFAVHMLYLGNPQPGSVAWPAALIGLAVTAGLMVLYVLSVNHITSDKRLEQLK
ncbi:MAG: hypothetical protein L0Y72_31755 [Gemmataceae bacterium]|nr:hypothetical protein [Gemmataceae bacterium]MCI0743629.1 hypothetical protein [Gemmataceae bacterium]